MFSTFHKTFKFNKVFEIVSCSKIKMCTNAVRPFTILVEGNIGSGKTTFLNNFRSAKNLLTLYEPIEEWKNLNGHDIMTLFYGDFKKWGFSFQSYVLLTMMKVHLKKTEKPVKMIERSIYSGRYVFIENLCQMNIIPQPDVAVLDEWFNWLIKNESLYVDLIIYLRTDPEVAYQRVKKRSRTGEDKITLEYIRRLHECHENWLFKKNNFICPAPVLCLNANKDVEAIKHDYEYFESQMKI